jgi:hypothetical protein
MLFLPLNGLIVASPRKNDKSGRIEVPVEYGTINRSSVEGRVKYNVKLGFHIGSIGVFTNPLWGGERFWNTLMNFNDTVNPVTTLVMEVPHSYLKGNSDNLREVFFPGLLGILKRADERGIRFIVLFDSYWTFDDERFLRQVSDFLALAQPYKKTLEVHAYYPEWYDRAHSPNGPDKPPYNNWRAYDFSTTLQQFGAFARVVEGKEYKFGFGLYAGWNSPIHKMWIRNRSAYPGSPKFHGWGIGGSNLDDIKWRAFTPKPLLPGMRALIVGEWSKKCSAAWTYEKTGDILQSVGRMKEIPEFWVSASPEVFENNGFITAMKEVRFLRSAPTRMD